MSNKTDPQRSQVELAVEMAQKGKESEKWFEQPIKAEKNGKRKRLIWKVVPAYLLVVMVGICSVAWLSGQTVKYLFEDSVTNDMKSKAGVLELPATEALKTGKMSVIQGFARDMGKRTDARVTVVMRDGTVMGDSHHSPKVMENHADRPEIMGAYQGDPTTSRRYSNTLQKEMIYAAHPLWQAGEVAAVVRVSIPTDAVQSAMRGVYWSIIPGGLLIALVAGTTMMVVFHRQISVPLQFLQMGARRFAKGKLDKPIPVPESAEIGTLAEVLNGMALQLYDTIHTISRQSEEQNAVLKSMVEGVIAVDKTMRVITMNDAAGRLVGVKPEEARGRHVSDVILRTGLRYFIEKVLSSGKSQVDEITMSVNDVQRDLHLAGSVMYEEHEIHGAVMVLHDVTELRKLEGIRQEFVANVSHELKTPIAAIKAAIETLIEIREDQMDEMDEMQQQPVFEQNGMPDPSERFMNIIARQSERLNQIVEDLLSLARIEQDESGELDVKEQLLVDVINSAVETCSSKADKKAIQIKTHIDRDITVFANAPLLEQALVNLLDNAVKYGKENTITRVTTELLPDEVAIAVSDQGQGIEEEHLPRLFERFYRTDKARSRAEGGTGLGLAIVKHVAQAHGGSINVESEVGVGTTFRIHLPLRD